ncbi:DUF4129 domain-containing protein [Streptomyces sp. NPDC006879]|uniref:DUF4129 domain-containing protein n=1 Tax=Streptomyces sp. NPDC006879 TaxID=3364767 RepID=UPI0036BB2208
MTRTGGRTTHRTTLLPTADEPPVTVGRLPAREAAEHELSKPIYHEHDPGLAQRAWNAFWEWIEGLFATASRAAPGGVLGLVVIVLFVIALAAALWWRLGAPRRAATSGAALFGERPHSAAEHRACAESFARANEWTQAVQERMRALVRGLEERALLDPRPGRTADEAAAEAARALPAHTVELHSAARGFDEVTYGERTATEAEYQRLCALDLAIEAAKPTLSDTPRGAGA